MISRFLPHGVRRLLGVKKPGRPPSYRLIDSDQGLPELLAAIERVPEVALDTEADNMFHYRVRVCLLQFLVDDEVYLVDVLSRVNLAPLWERLAQTHLVMHGSDFDLRLLHDLCGFRAKSLFDTMLAAQLLGRQRIGLASLLEEHFGVTLDKNGQKANWSRRPLTPKLLDYASLDVWHLFELRDLLERELTRLNRETWMEQQCRAQIAAGCDGFAPATEHDWRIGKSERLRGRSLTVLHAVWHWREEAAKRIDTPPFKVCSSELLLKIATAAQDEGTVEAVLAGINLGKRHDRLFPALQAAVRAGLARDPQSLPRRPGRDHGQLPLNQTEVTRMERIKVERDGVAKKLALDSTLIANRAQLAQIARDPGRLDQVLLPWQAELLRGLPSLRPPA
jgi:ribonuclease D